MSYDIPYHVDEGIRVMFKVADAEIMVMRDKEKKLLDKDNSPAWGYVAQELTPMLRRVKAEIKEAQQKGDVMPAIAALQEKIDVFELDDRDPTKVIFVKATKAMLRSIDPNQYPEAQDVLDNLSKSTLARA
ncbi:MAG: hypothetical protein LW823_08185 [Rickettsiales bacterium]|jgi:hypothetical protein|nr:hypothetical protein [Rickettsiales bacterium]